MTRPRDDAPLIFLIGLSLAALALVLFLAFESMAAAEPVSDQARCDHCLREYVRAAVVDPAPPGPHERRSGWARDWLGRWGWRRPKVVETGGSEADAARAAEAAQRAKLVSEIAALSDRARTLGLYRASALLWTTANEIESGRAW